MSTPQTDIPERQKILVMQFSGYLFASFYKRWLKLITKIKLIIYNKLSVFYREFSWWC